MKQIKLKLEQEWTGVQNVLRDKRLKRNALIDAKRKLKKDKDKVNDIKKSIYKIDEDILTLENTIRELESKFDKMSQQMGFVRLKNYVLSEALYDNLISYKEFIKKNCYTDDKETIDTIEKAIDHIKKLPFECGDCENDRFREVYNAIADAFIEKLNDIVSGIFSQVMIELEKEEESKKLKK